MRGLKHHRQFSWHSAASGWAWHSITLWPSATIYWWGFHNFCRLELTYKYVLITLRTNVKTLTTLTNVKTLGLSEFVKTLTTSLYFIKCPVKTLTFQQNVPIKGIGDFTFCVIKLRQCCSRGSRSYEKLWHARFEIFIVIFRMGKLNFMRKSNLMPKGKIHFLLNYVEIYSWCERNLIGKLH